MTTRTRVAKKEGIGARIKGARLTMRWTQRQLAARIGVTNPSVTMWENGKRHPSLENLASVAMVCGVSLMELMRGTGHDYDEQLLLHHYRGLTPRARQNLMELVCVAENIGREIELQREPAQLEVAAAA